jgi:hypothetical protein
MKIRIKSPIIIMSILTTLFGCKEQDSFGPDYTQTIQKAVHIDSGPTVTYQMPGNMSNILDFGKRYIQESPRTIHFSRDSGNECEQWHWRKSCDLDGGMWDYKMKGSASLNLRIEMLPTEDGHDVEAFITHLYDDFLNGTEGLNTGVRTRNPGVEDEDLGSWIRPIPNDFRWYQHSGRKVLTWSENGDQTGNFARYHAITIEDNLFLNFAFLYTVSADSEKELALIKTSVAQHIDDFMSRVKILDWSATY